MKKIISIFIITMFMVGCLLLEEKTNYTAPEWAIGNWGDPNYNYIAYSITDSSFVQYWPNGSSVSWVLNTNNDSITSIIDGDEWSISFGITEFYLQPDENGSAIIIDESSRWSKIE